MKSSKIVSYLPVLLCLILISFGTSMAQEEEPESAPPPAEEFAPVQSVEFAGNTALTDEELQAAANIQPGQPISITAITEAIRRIEAAYDAAGYIGSVSFYEFRDEPAPRTLIFNIIEVTVAEIRFTGLQRTREETMHRLMQTEPGGLYNQFVLQADVTRLFATGIFDDIQVFLEPSETAQQVVVVIEVVEARQRRIDLGGSYAPEGRLVFQVQYTDANLFGRAQQLSVSANTGTIQGKLGGSITYFNPIVGTPGQTLLARGFSDIFFRFGQDLVVSPDVGRYFERRTGLQTTFSRPAGTARRLSYSARYENVDVENLPVELMATDLSPDASVVGVGARYVEDRRTFRVLPASGEYISGFAEPGFADFGDEGGSGAIARVQGEWRRYFPLQTVGDQTEPVRNVAVRLSAGTSLGDLPFFEQYFVGGILNLRGYRESRFWGKHFVTLNTELRWPLGQQLVGVAFVDIGDAWGTDFRFEENIDTPFLQHDNLSLQTGAGIGVWWVSGFGIVRLEYAWGDENRFHFAVGETF